MTPAALRLEFERVELEQGNSGALSKFFADRESLCGIYWLDFANGESYVGQSVTARTRLSTHRRRWDDAIAVQFAECSAERLDEFEQAAITHAEQSRPLRNKLLTRRPGGSGDLVVTTRAGQSLVLPWDRSRRNDSNSLVEPVLAASPAQEASFVKLAGLDSYPQLRHVLQTLVREALPSPRVTQRLLWSLSAMPSTTAGYGRRLATLNSGRLEIFWAFENASSGAPAAFLNVDPAAHPRVVKAALRRARVRGIDVVQHRYSAMSSVTRLEADSPEHLANALEVGVVVEAAYTLVVSLMRQGINPLGRHHNPALARDALDGVPHGPRAETAD